MAGQRGMGWLPDYPDFRDYTVRTDRVEERFSKIGETRSVAGMLAKVGVTKATKLPAAVDLRSTCSPVEDQGQLGSCTAHAGAGLAEYYERKVYGRHLDASRLFLYKATRSLMGVTGDTGAFLRTTMGAMRVFGLPPERFWPYDVERFDEEPTSFVYSFAKEYQSMQYFRLDPPEWEQGKVLDVLKRCLAHGIPAMFGFTVYDSVEQAEESGKIPYPTIEDKVVGGHAVDAVGYDDSVVIENDRGGGASTGALLIRNSWGLKWGEHGYGWLPYEYVLAGIAEDWWSLLKSEWVDIGTFGLEQTGVTR